MKKLRVLLVDDEIMIREGFKKLLTGKPMSVSLSARQRMEWKQLQKLMRSSLIL